MSASPSSNDAYPMRHLGHASNGSPGPLDDPELAKENLSTEEKKRVFLQVIDARYDGSTPQRVARISAGDGSWQIPPHEDNTARILDVTTHSDLELTGLRDPEGPKRTRKAREGLMQFLQNRYTEKFDPRRIFRWLDDPLLVNDIGSITNQWSQSLVDSESHFFRLVNRTSLQQDPMNLELRPRDSYLTCARDAENRLLVIIVHDVWYRQEFCKDNSKVGDYFENPRSTEKILKGDGWISFYDNTIETFSQLLILDFLEASIYLQPVDYSYRLIYPERNKNEAVKILAAKNPHLQVPLGLFEPRLSAKSKEAFKEIEDAEGILRNVNNLVNSIEHVISALESKELSENRRGDKYQIRVKNLEDLYKERERNSGRAREALERQLDYLSKDHAISEAKSIRILTVLASVYLPLSLSSALLSMNSPLKQVAHDRKITDSDKDWVGTNLLFDFFGVFIVLATVTILIVYAITLVMWLDATGLAMLTRKLRILSVHFSGTFRIQTYGKVWRFDGFGGSVFKLIRVVTKWWIGLGFLITLLVVFVIGMMRDSQTAWNWAKYVIATYLAGTVVWAGLYVAVYGSLWQRAFGGRWYDVLSIKRMESMR